MATKSWEKHRQTIVNLYIQEGRTLEDVRGIMKTKHNFEASIRSYRQHFQVWDIGKYNCKKRQRRQGTPASPCYSLPAPRSISETFDPGSPQVSSCASLLSPGQLPLPDIQPAVSYTQSPDYGAHHPPGLRLPSLPKPCIKTENGGGEIGQMDVPMDHDGLSIGPCRPFSAFPPRTLTPSHHDVPPSTVIRYQAYVPPNTSGGGAWKPRSLASPFGQSLWQVP